ncbi:MAG: DNA translocase FtsK, partial [Planctomycetota bacterium]|nr:DNA translocase FtsK [Planctomycetota bacterium]
LDLEPEDAPQAESAPEEGAPEEEVTEEADDVADADTLEASSDTQDEEAAEDGDDAAEQAPVRAAGRSAGARRRRRRSRTKHPELPLFGPYPFPPLSLFRDPPESAPVQTQRFIDENKTAIEQRLASFKVEATVVDVKVGPTVTMYEVSLGEGVRVQKISTFEPDLAAALRAVSVRVVAPIPGRDTVGIEVPNKRRQMVLMRELLEKFGSSSQMAIPLFLGKDAAGEPIVEDLARMPHLLIAGTTGSGKSVCINVILLSILMTRTPQQVRLILIDPKMVELQAYKQIPHLACDVVTNMKKAPAVLEWAVDEMERRYEMLSKVGTTNISNFNKMGQAEIESRLQRPIEPTDAHLSYIVLVIDEFADLMNTAQKDVEESIQRLAQKSRAVGLHVILATQRPSANVITGVIKANLPAQIAFKVSRKLDSRVILDTNGAEKLLGHGDMLYVSPSMNQTVRAQGALVSEDEVRAVVSHIVENGPQAGAIPALVQTEKAQKLGFAQKDELYEKAVEVILSQQRGSATLIQRAFSVGYTRATRLLEMMEEDGLVGPFCGSKSRDVLMTVEEWQEREAAMEAELAAIDADDGFEDDEDFEDDEEVEATLEAEEVDEESEEDVLGGDGPGAARAVSEGEADDEEGETGDSDDEGAAAALRSSGDDASDDDEEVEDDDEEESDDEACEDEDVGADLDADASEDDDEESEDEDLAGEDELLGDDEVVFEAEEDETAEDAEDEVGEEDEVDAVWGEVDEDPDDDSDDDMEDEDSEDEDSEDEAEADAR